MVTNVPMHAEKVCVLQSFVFDDEGFLDLKKRIPKIAGHVAHPTLIIPHDGCACNLLASPLISIAVSGKNGVALEY